MFELMATLLVIFKAITDCVLALRREDVRAALINGFVYVFLLYL